MRSCRTARCECSGLGRAASAKVPSLEQGGQISRSGPAVGVTGRSQATVGTLPFSHVRFMGLSPRSATSPYALRSRATKRSGSLVQSHPSRPSKASASKPRSPSWPNACCRIMPVSRTHAFSATCRAFRPSRRSWEIGWRRAITTSPASGRSRQGLTSWSSPSWIGSGSGSVCLTGPVACSPPADRRRP